MTGMSPGEGGAALRILVVDDEPPALEELAYLVRRSAAVAEVTAVGTAEEALRQVLTGRFDAVLTDIKMPGFDGLALTRALTKLAHPPKVVFVTAHEEHAVTAFTLDVADYVLKPVRPERLAEALRRVVGPVAAVAPAPNEGDDERVAVELGGVTRFVRRGDVAWVGAHGDYVRLHVAATTHLVRVPISTLEERWAPGFVRIHRSVLVNLAHVRELASADGRWTIATSSGHRLPVSRRQVRDLRTALRSMAETGHGPRDHAPRDHAPRDHAPRDHAPRDNGPARD